MFSTARLGDLKKVLNELDLPDDTLVLAKFDYTEYAQEMGWLSVEWINGDGVWVYGDETSEHSPYDQEVVCVRAGN